MKKVFFVPLAMLLFSMSVNAQKNHDDSDYILFKGKDTTFCYIKEMGGGGTTIGIIVYTDESGNEIKLKGNEDMDKIISVKCGGLFMDNVPINPKNNAGKKTLMEPYVNGKIKVYGFNKIIAKTSKNGERKLFRGVIPSNHDIIKLDNGKMYFKDRDNINNFILPYMKKCPNFKSAIKEDDKEIYDEIYNEIKNYNNVCK